MSGLYILRILVDFMILSKFCTFRQGGGILAWWVRGDVSIPFAGNR